MSFIKCTKCGNEYSENANFCPNCGCPTETAENGKKLNNETIDGSGTNNTEKKSGKCKYVILVVFAFLMMLFIMAKLSRTTCTQVLIIVAAISYLYSICVSCNIIKEKKELPKKFINIVFYVCLGLIIFATYLNFSNSEKTYEYEYEEMSLKQIKNILNNNENMGNKTEENKTEENKAEENKAEGNKVEENKIEENKIEEVINAETQNKEEENNENIITDAQLEEVKTEIVLPKEGSKLANDFDKEISSDTNKVYINVDNIRNTPTIQQYGDAYVTDGVNEYLSLLKEMGFDVQVTKIENKEPYAGFFSYETYFKVSKNDLSWTMYLGIQDETFIEYEFDILLK